VRQCHPGRQRRQTQRDVQATDPADCAGVKFLRALQIVIIPGQGRGARMPDDHATDELRHGELKDQADHV
jgi:hypothetical protein